MTALIFFGTTLILTMLLSVAMVHWGAKILKSEKRSIYRATAAVALNFVIGILALFAVRRLVTEWPTSLVWLLALLSIGLNWWVYVSLFRVKPGRGLLLWLMSIVPNIAVALASDVIIKPYLFEAFVTPSNNMAPTLNGWHKTTACPKCGEAFIVSQPRPEQAEEYFEAMPMGICSSCLRSSYVDNPKKPIQRPDSMLVDKTATPRRWDLVVFRLPSDPSVLFVMRLVGLPGENVHLVAGAVRINGKQLEPPEEIHGIRYEDDLQFRDPANPVNFNVHWNLKQDEFIVLGDFSERSMDSRYWGPVPRDQIVGVVTLRYWPPARWKVFR